MIITIIIHPPLLSQMSQYSVTNVQPRWGLIRIAKKSSSKLNQVIIRGSSVVVVRFGVWLCWLLASSAGVVAVDGGFAA